MTTTPSLSRAAAPSADRDARPPQGMARPRFVPVVGNPYVGAAHVAVERLSAAFTLLGQRTMILDAADASPAASEAALLDLSSGIERLTPKIWYLAARGLPMRYVDTHGSCARLLDELTRSGCQADVIVVHADAADMARLFTATPARPVLLAADHAESLKHAYAAWKLLAQRRGGTSADLMLLYRPGRARAQAIAASLSRCADAFMGAVLADWATVDPLSDPGDAPDAAVTRLAEGQCIQPGRDDARLALPISRARDVSASRLACP